MEAALLICTRPSYREQGIIILTNCASQGPPAFYLHHRVMKAYVLSLIKSPVNCRGEIVHLHHN